MIGAQDTQVEHGLCIGRQPPSTGEFETFLDDVSMSALDFAGADRQVGGDRGRIVKLAGTVGHVAKAAADIITKGTGIDFFSS